MAPFDDSRAVPKSHQIDDETNVHEHRPANLRAVLLSSAVQILPANVLENITSDFSTLAKLSDRTKGKRARWTREKVNLRLEALPADPLPLRPVLEAILPARLRIKTRRWSTIRSSVARCLKLTDWIDGDEVLLAPLTEDWQCLCDKVRGGPQISVVTHHARFYSRTGIAPADLTDADTVRCQQWRGARTLRLKITQSTNAFRMIWNQMAAVDPAWPQQRLKPPHNPLRYVADAQLSAGFIAEVEAYAQKLRNPDPLDPMFNKTRAETTVIHTQRVLLRAGAKRAASGQPPRCLADLAQPAAVYDFLMDLYNRLGKGKAWPFSARYSAAALRDVARFVAATDPSALSQADLAKVEGYRKLVRVDTRHLTKKNRDRLAVLDTPEMERRFLRLSDDCFARADELLTAGQAMKAAQLHKRALAFAILICKPLRRANLVELDYFRHFRRDDNDRIIALHIPAEEVHKSQVEVEAFLPPKLIHRVEKHWCVYRPILVTRKGTSALFANKEGQPLHPDTLAGSVMALIAKWIGVECNVHLIRHWSASVLFEEDPRNGAVVQHLLGHMNPASGDKYGARRTRAAHRIYAELLQRRLTAHRRGRTRR
jgi:site-specific recombinase XerD